MKKIILASGSPRRKKLLAQLGLKFETVVGNFQEIDKPNLQPQKLVEYFSLKKAQNVAQRFQNALVIAADTTVVYQNQIIGKPITKPKAIETLRLLSGNMHSVFTGLTVIDTKTNKTITASTETKVFFKKMTQEEIDAYVATGEPLDKAGAYGIQELGSVFIEKIEGDFYNVVGLPLFLLYQILKKFGVNII